MTDITPSPDNGPDNSPDAAKTDEDLFNEAIARLKLAESAWSTNHKSYLEAVRFRNLDQWPTKTKKWREDAERPCLVVDKVNQYVRQVVNDGRQNRPGIKVHPVDDGNEEAAEGLQGLIRRIVRQSDAEDAFDTALDCAAGGGFGFWRIITDYEHENTFNQEIFIRRIRNPTAVFLDPNFQQADGSDAQWGFIIDEMPKAEYKKKFPNAKYVNWDSDISRYSEGWVNSDNIRYAEYFYCDEEPGVLHLLSDGTSIRDDEYQEVMENTPDELKAMAPTIIESRSIPLPKVRWCRLSGAEILDKKDWLGKYIPIIPVFGNEYDVDGKVYYSGLVQPAMDAQRLYNYMRSAYAEWAALQPKAPFVAAVGQIEGRESEWEGANRDNIAVLQYNPVDANGTALPPPTRSQPPLTAPGFAQDMQLAEHDIQASMGMYQASIGQPSNEKSGRAILARQKEGDTSTFHYQDNQNRAIRYTGKQLADLAPKIYDAKRSIRILHEDGSTSMMQLDPNIQSPVEKRGDLTLYNLNVGRYDVDIESGPSYNTKRMEAADAQLQLAQAVPQLWQVGGDIMIRNQDWPGADELADRWKAILPPPIQQMMSQQQPLPPEIQQAIQQVQQGQAQLTQAHQQLQGMAQQVAQEKAATDADRAKLEVMAKDVDAKTKILNANFQELSAKLELMAIQKGLMVPQVMPPGKDEPAIAPDAAPPPNLQMMQPAPPPGGVSISGG